MLMMMYKSHKTFTCYPMIGNSSISISYSLLCLFRIAKKNNKLPTLLACLFQQKKKSIYYQNIILKKIMFYAVNYISYLLLKLLKFVLNQDSTNWMFKVR